MRHALLAACLVLAIQHEARGDWLPGGTPVSSLSGPLYAPQLAPDGLGGAYVLFVELQEPYWEFIRMQRLSGSGEVALGWSPEGHRIVNCPAPFEYRVAPAGVGGVHLTWTEACDSKDFDARSVSSTFLTSSGAGPGLGRNTLSLLTSWATYSSPVLARADDHGAFVAWVAPDNPTRIALQRLGPTGVVAAGWPQGGIEPVATNTASACVSLVADGQNGVYVPVIHGVATGEQVVLQRLAPDGSPAAGWPPQGIRASEDATGRKWAAQTCRDGAGGAFVVWTHQRTGQVGTPSGVYATRISPGGEISPGWPGAGLALVPQSNVAANWALVADGSGGFLAVMVGTSLSRPYPAARVVVARVTGDGATASGWQDGGVLATDVADQQAPSFPFIRVEPDGLGGVFVAWKHVDGGIFVTYVNPSASVASYRVDAGDGRGVYYPSIANIEPGSCIVAWTQSEGGAPWGRLLAQRVQVDGTVSATAALVSVDSEPGRVRLVWWLSDALRVTVWRAEGFGEWRELATREPDGRGHVEYVDREVTPGRRYRYRLGILESGRERFLAETSVEVPVPFLELFGFSPNPPGPNLTVAFALAASTPARLELFDLAGRRVLAREVGSLGPGRHLVNLATRSALLSGAYVLRLTQGGASRVARGVVIR